MTKVMTIVGTRPEIIRLSRVINRLEAEVDHCLVHTGQNWDPQLSDVFFKELDLRQPDHWLDVPATSLGAVLGGVLAGIEPILLQERPDAVLVLGDTNSCIAVLIAKRLGIPVFHMEAGNRCFDENVPEETNRRVIDHVADFNLCYTEHARHNLLAEGLPTRRVFVTGSPMAEVLAAYNDRIEQSDALVRLGLQPGQYFLVSMHREENIDDPDNLDILLRAIEDLSRRSGLRVIVTRHPRLRKQLEERGGVEDSTLVEFMEPFGFLDYNKLQRGARCVLSDSGTISEESAITGFPAVTIRNSMERPEALDTGTVVLTGIEPGNIGQSVDLVVRQWDAGERQRIPRSYQVLDCSVRVSRLIRGLSTVHATWLGLRPKLWRTSEL
ncbi:UDP-N-acetylglucosamine 2-epimerase (non-hydrolyzing) [Actinopolymorpha sp. B11F2]|uniref:non-hydrolyzing UDP-N-acetylglucosamine 2-epimerase n=1 Tax=Actinopolymorpha sp. B11F2 TaxID=3160862 RepID=UPI0032E3C19A